MIPTLVLQACDLKITLPLLYMTFPKGTAVLKVTVQFSGQTDSSFPRTQCVLPEERSQRAPLIAPEMQTLKLSGWLLPSALAWDVQDAAPQVTTKPEQVAVASRNCPSSSFIKMSVQKA